jgi:hypothetical protein
MLPLCSKYSRVKNDQFATEEIINFYTARRKATIAFTSYRDSAQVLAPVNVDLEGVYSVAKYAQLYAPTPYQLQYHSFRT